MYGHMSVPDMAKGLTGTELEAQYRKGRRMIAVMPWDAIGHGLDALGHTNGDPVGEYRTFRRAGIPGPELLTFRRVLPDMAYDTNGHAIGCYRTFRRAGIPGAELLAAACPL